MGHYEDFWWEIDANLKKDNLQEAFKTQLNKMSHQDKHRYKDIRTKWEYAYNKVLILSKKK